MKTAVIFCRLVTSCLGLTQERSLKRKGGKRTRTKKKRQDPKMKLSIRMLGSTMPSFFKKIFGSGSGLHIAGSGTKVSWAQIGISPLSN